MHLHFSTQFHARTVDHFHDVSRRYVFRAFNMRIVVRWPSRLLLQSDWLWIDIKFNVHPDPDITHLYTVDRRSHTYFHIFCSNPNNHNYIAMDQRDNCHSTRSDNPCTLDYDKQAIDIYIKYINIDSCKLNPTQHFWTFWKRKHFGDSHFAANQFYNGDNNVFYSEHNHSALWSYSAVCLDWSLEWTSLFKWPFTC